MNKAPVYGTVIFLLTAFSSYAQTIKGHVSTPQQPLEGAAVYIPGKNYHTASDASGTFELTVKPGKYTLRASHTGYVDAAKEVTIAAGETITIDFLLSDNTDKLNDVVVVSARRPRHISDIPGTVWVIDSAALQTQIKAGVPLKEALGLLIPGLDIGPQGRTNYGQNMRGRSALVMIDGVSLNSTRGISRQFDGIDPFNIEKIEVLSGASAIYGGGATGGIINIVTKKATGQKPAFETEAGERGGLRNGDDHDWHVAQSISGGNKWVTARLGAVYQQNGAAYDAHNKQVLTDITQTDLQYNRSIDLLGNVRFRIASNQSLDITGQYYDSKFNGSKGLYLGYNLGGAFGNKPDSVFVKDGFSSDVEPRTKRSMLNLQYQLANAPGGQTLQVQVYGRTERLNFYPFPGTLSNTSPAIRVPYMSSSMQNTDLYGARLVLSKQWRTVSITYGADADHEKFSATQALFNAAMSYASGGLINKTFATTGRYPGYHVNGISGFAQGEWQALARLSVSGGIRQQHMAVSVQDFAAANQQAFIANGYGKTADLIPGGKNSYDVTLLNAGLIYKINQGQQVWVNYTQGFSLPDPAKYYGQGVYQLTGDNWKLAKSVSIDSTPLSGIKTYQYEAGYRYRSASGFHIQGAGFYALSNKNLQVVPLTLAVNVVDDKQRNYGFEGEAGYSKATGLEAGVNTQLIASETRLNGRWVKQPVNTASPSKINIYAGWKRKQYAVRLQLLHSFDVKDSVNQLNGYTTLDLIGNIKLPLGHLTIGVQNLLNSDYQTIWSQRSEILYKGLATPKTFQYYGRGRTFALTYVLNY